MGKIYQFISISSFPLSFITEMLAFLLFNIPYETFLYNIRINYS